MFLNSAFGIDHFIIARIVAFSPHPGVLLVEADVVSMYIRELGRSAVSTHMS